jgi:hypothetical protein
MRKLLLVLAAIMACSISLPAQQKQILSAAAASCSASNASCLIYGVDQSAGAATFTVSANASGNTLQFEASGDNGTTWVALNVTPSNSTTAVTSTTGTGTWQANVAGYTQARIRMSTLVGGTSTVSIITSIASARSNGGGGGGGTIAGTIANTQVAFGTAANTIGGNSGFTFSSPNLTIPGNLTLSGSSSGSASIGTAAAAGSPCTFLVPTTSASSVPPNFLLTSAAPSSGSCQTSWSFNGPLGPWATTGGGTAQAQVVAFNQPPLTDAGLVAGVQICWLPAAANTGGAPTLAGTGSSTFSAHAIIKEPNGIALVANDLTTTAWACVIYDGTNFELLNPQTVNPAFVQTSQTNVYGAFLQDFTAATMEVPEAAGFTTNVNSTIGNDTTNNNIHLWVNSADSLAAAEASAITANTIPKATNSTQSLLTASSLKDNGTTVTTTEPFGIGAVPPTACGTSTGCVALAEASTTGTPTAGQDYMRADSTSHSFLCSFNGVAEVSCGGSGTVTSIATTSPITGGTITSTGTIACATCVTSAAALTNNAIVTGSGLQASKTPAAGVTVLPSVNGIGNTANIGPGIIFNAVGQGVMSEGNGVFGITNNTAGGSGTLYSQNSLFGTNDTVVDVLPVNSSAWAVVRERHTVGQTGAGLILATQDAVPISFRPNATESARFLSGGGIEAIGGSSPLTGTGTCATITTTAGGTWAGTGKCTGTSGAATLIITPGSTAANGWVCHVQDETTRADLFQQTSHSTTACTLTSSAVVQNDIIIFTAFAF